MLLGGLKRFFLQCIASTLNTRQFLSGRAAQSSGQSKAGLGQPATNGGGRRRSGHPQTAAQELRGWRGSLYDFEQIASRHQIDKEAPCPGSATSARCRCRGGIGCCGREHRSARANIVAARFGRLKQQRRCWRWLVGWQCLGAAARRMRPMCRKLEPRPSSRRWRWSARGN